MRRRSKQISTVDKSFVCFEVSKFTLGIMERFLYEVGMENQGGGGQSLVGTIKIAVLPIAKVFTICFLGFLLAYFKILPSNGRKLLNGVRK